MLEEAANELPLAEDDAPDFSAFGAAFDLRWVLRAGFDRRSTLWKQSSSWELTTSPCPPCAG